MGRPKKLIPDLYWLEQKQQFAANVGGKRKLLGKDRAAADLERLRLVNRHRAGPGAQPDELLANDTPTVGEVLVAYRKSLRPDMDARHVFRIDRALALVAAEYGELDAGKLTSLHLVAVRAALVKAGELSRGYINSLVRAFKTAWNWAIESTLVLTPQAHSVLKVRALEEGEGGVETEGRPPADPAAVAATLPHLPPLLRTAVQLLRLTGMRPGELLRMRRCDVSTSPKEVLHPLPNWAVAASKGAGKRGKVVWLYVPPKHKTKKKGKVRVVALGPQAQKLLKPWLSGLAPEDVVFSPRRVDEMWRAEKREKRKSKVTPSQVARAERSKSRPGRKPGEVYSTDTFDGAVRNAVEAAGVAPWTPYQLRHAVGTSVAEVHGDEVAGEVLGHEAGSQALRHYTRQRLARLVAFAAAEG